MIELAAIFIGFGFAFSYCSRSNKTNAVFLNKATSVDKLEGLEQHILESEPWNSIVVYGTVGSTSPIETNRSKTLGVFYQETASIVYERNLFGEDLPMLEDEAILLNRKEVPWYLEDGTARVNVMGYKGARGFDYILKAYEFTDPVAKHFKSLLSEKNVKVTDPNSCITCEEVLEIGTPLTIVGVAGRDQDGAPMIKRADQVFNGRIELEELICDMESNSESYGISSIYFIATGMILLAMCVLEDLNEA